MLLASPFHRQKQCGDRSNTDGLALYLLCNVKSLYQQITNLIIDYQTIYYIVGLVEKSSAAPTDKNHAEIGAILTDLHCNYYIVYNHCKNKLLT